MGAARKKKSVEAEIIQPDADLVTGPGREAEPAPAAQPDHPHRRVLVAEDNKVTQDLLKLLLNQRGHEVQVAPNGQAALKALETGKFDVVLMDFHLPEMDGVKVATSFRAACAGAKAPRFVAITSDIEGLLGHVDGCENFDNVLPKPFDLERVVNVVEGETEEFYVPAQRPLPEVLSQPVARDGVPDETREVQIQGLGHEFLRWPDDFEGERLGTGFLQALHEDASRFDAVLVREAAKPGDLGAVWTTKGLQVLPVIDLAGSLGHAADLDGSSLNFGETDQVIGLIADFHTRRARLHQDITYSDDLGTKILSRIYVKDAPLTPAYDPSAAGLIGYNLVLDGALAAQEAALAFNQGYLDREFFDRFHLCGSCGSSRLHVREECNTCRSADLSEEAYLHHFPCAYQGSESDFRQGDDLVCPKCRHELSHFGVDYDKPGSLMRCGSCGAVESEPQVGFVCLDCTAHMDTETADTRDVYAYKLLDRGIGYVETGRAMLGRQNRAMRLAGLPLEVIVAVDKELKAYRENARPFAVLDIAYSHAKRIEHEHGLRACEQARDLFLENLNNTLRREDVVIKGMAYDYAILKGVTREEACDGLDRLREQAGEGVRHDLGAAVQVFGPEDFL